MIILICLANKIGNFDIFTFAEYEGYGYFEKVIYLIVMFFLLDEYGFSFFRDTPKIEDFSDVKCFGIFWDEVTRLNKTFIFFKILN